MRYVTLRVWHPDCWMLELSDRHRDVCVESRGVCHHGHDVQSEAIVRGRDAVALEAALAATVPADVRREVLHVRNAQAQVYSRYPAYRSIYGPTVRSGFLVNGPILHENGYERWHVLADADTLRDGLGQLRDAGEVRVERIADTPPTHGNPLAGILSPRQETILRRAVESGYYEWPRTKNLSRLAAELGISPATCLEHLRRAEGKLVPRAVEDLRGHP